MTKPDQPMTHTPVASAVIMANAPEHPRAEAVPSSVPMPEQEAGIGNENDITLQMATDADDETSMVLEASETRANASLTPGIHIEVFDRTRIEADPDCLRRLLELFKSVQGNDPVHLHLPTTDGDVIVLEYPDLMTNYNQIEEELMSQLSEWATVDFLA
jgi:hypothetical protein